MKTKLLTLATALLCMVTFSSCSKDDEGASYPVSPSLTTWDFLAMIGLSEAELDAKMEDFRKIETNEGASYNNYISFYVSAFGSDENFLSVTIQDDVAIEVDVQHMGEESPYEFFTTIRDNLLSEYPDLATASSTYENSLIIYETTGLKITVAKDNDTWTGQFKIQLVDEDEDEE